MTKARKITELVEGLYESIGWTMVGDVTFDAQSSEDLRECSKVYVAACRLRVLRHLPPSGDRILDMASGPIQYTEYLKYSEGFNTRVCVDLSQRALDMAKTKLGPRGEYHVGDFLELDIDSVDAAVSLHTLYHIDKELQEAAVRKLIAVTKPGGRIVIVYSNPAYFISALFAPARKLGRAIRPMRNAGESPNTIYFYRYPLSWWNRFNDSGIVSIHPWRTFSTRDQRILFFNNRLGTRILAKLFALEDRYPRFFCTIGCYPMIVVQKKT